MSMGIYKRKLGVYKNLYYIIIHQNKKNMKTALITGINGMDGSHLAELLIEKGYNSYQVI